MQFGNEEPTRLGKAATWAVIAAVGASATRNVAAGTVPAPGAFVVTVAGFLLFATAKLGLIVRGR